MDTRLKDKVALVSGSTAGIGYAIATALAAEGVGVIAVSAIKAKTGNDVLGFAGNSRS